MENLTEIQKCILGGCVWRMKSGVYFYEVRTDAITYIEVLRLVVMGYMEDMSIVDEEGTRLFGITTKGVDYVAEANTPPKPVGLWDLVKSVMSSLFR
jgi:hypothetical protein